jgi:hypothetical protein
MESNNLTTRTYTALTCKLVVSTKDKQIADLNLRAKSQHQQDRDTPVDFTIHLDDLDRGESELITLKGQFYQLDRLQQVVNKYITELIAKFPLPNMNNTTSDQTRSTTDRNPDMPTPETETGNSINNKLYPNQDNQFTQSGLMKNLPGLRDDLTKSPAESGKNPHPNPVVTTTGISKLFGGWNKQNNGKNPRTKEQKQQNTPLGASASVTSGFGKQQIEDRLASKANHEQTTNSEQPPTTPSLTGSERSLDHQLHLGDLATPASGDVVTLSPIQLFDLSNVLDEYAAADTTKDPVVETPIATKSTPPVTLSVANIPGDNDRFTDPDAATISLARLPNLPKPATGLQNSQVYNRTRRSNHAANFSFMSVVPWAAAAAVAVGVPLLLLDPKPNPLKDATSKVKVPDLETVKKTVAVAMSPPVVDPEPTSTTANPNLPKPWDAQPVQPPQSKTPSINTATQPPQTVSKIGTAPLPASLIGTPGKDLPAAAAIPSGNQLGVLSVLPRNGAQAGIAPNPLNSQISSPVEPKSIAGNTESRPSKLPPATTVKPSRSITNSAAAPVIPGSSSAISPGTVSVSTQPILLPSDLPGIGINPSDSPQMPSNPPQMDSAATNRPVANKTAKQKAKLKVAAKAVKPKAVKQTGITVARQPLFEQAEPMPVKPQFTNPEQPQPNNDIADAQNLPTAQVQPFPAANNGGDWPVDAVENSPSLQETKRYFQSKWKATDSQSSPLQYIVQVSGKSGIVQSVSPQGEAAITYLKQTKLIKAGQKLVSPSGSADQKIRVVLQTDGNVDTFMEP